MKYILTIEADSAAELATLLQGHLPASTSLQPAPVQQPQAMPNLMQSGPMPGATDDDESGPTNTAAPAFDSAGLPWDERIHAKTKATVADGTWRKKRNVQDVLVAQVEAELRSRTAPVQQQPAPVQQMPDPAQMQQPQMMQSMPTTQPQMMQQPAPMPVQQPQQMPAPVPQGGALDFPTFMQGVSAAMRTVGANGAALVDQTYLAQVAAHYGLTAITDLQGRQDMIPTIVAQFRNDGRWVA